MPLTSTHNPLLQNVRRAVAGGRPMEDGAIAAEGPHLLKEALGSEWKVERVFFTAEGEKRHGGLLAEAVRGGAEVTETGERAFQGMSGTEESQGILALLRPQVYTWPEVLRGSGPVVILDGLQDPGNAGTIVRSAEAFGAQGVALAAGSVRISNGKLLRAAAGSLFRLACLENQTREEIVRQVKGAGRRLFALAMKGTESVNTAELRQPFALVVGSEGSGVSDELLEASISLAIPTESVESLNAAIACSVTLYEAARQRGWGPA